MNLISVPTIHGEALVSPNTKWHTIVPTQHGLEARGLNEYNHTAVIESPFGRANRFLEDWGVRLREHMDQFQQELLVAIDWRYRDTSKHKIYMKAAMSTVEEVIEEMGGAIIDNKSAASMGMPHKEPIFIFKLHVIANGAKEAADIAVRARSEIQNRLVALAKKINCSSYNRNHDEVYLWVKEDPDYFMSYYNQFKECFNPITGQLMFDELKIN